MNEQIKETAKKLGRDPFSAAEKLGIAVLDASLPDSTKGLCYTVGEKRIILINSSLDDKTKEYVCAHELGHALLHPTLNLGFLISNTYYNTERFEREADEFASAMLIDEDLFHSGEFASLTVAELSRLTGFPEKLFLLQM